MPLIEQTKEIVHSFNRIYGDVLVDPKIMLAENEVCQRLPEQMAKQKCQSQLEIVFILRILVKMFGKR